LASWRSCITRRPTIDVSPKAIRVQSPPWPTSRAMRSWALICLVSGGTIGDVSIELSRQCSPRQVESMSKEKISSALAWSSVIWNAVWTVSRLGPKACSVASSGGAMGASENGSTTIWGAELGARELGELGGWSLGAGELGELVPDAPFELAENEPSTVCRAQRVQSPELGRKPAQLGQVGWDVLRRAMLESGRAEGLKDTNQPCSSAIWNNRRFAAGGQ